MTDRFVQDIDGRPAQCPDLTELLHRTYTCGDRIFFVRGVDRTNPSTHVLAEDLGTGALCPVSASLVRRCLTREQLLDAELLELRTALELR